MIPLNSKLGFATFVHNEIQALPGLLEDVLPFVDEITVVDTGSSDGTWEYLRAMELKHFDMVPKLRPYRLRIPFDPDHFDFGYVRSVAAHLNHCGYVFMLDADERMEREHLEKLVSWHKLALDNKWPAMAFPRRNWYDSPETRQLENEEPWPDWQLRLIRNDGTIYWRRPVHEVALWGPLGYWSRPMGCHSVVIHHHHDWFKSLATEPRTEDLNTAYRLLAKSDPEWADSYTEDMLPADEQRRQLVYKLYRELLNRNPTPSEAQMWAGSTLSGEDIRKEISSSEEYEDTHVPD